MYVHMVLALLSTHPFPVFLIGQLIFDRLLLQRRLSHLTRAPNYDGRGKFRFQLPEQHVEGPATV